MFARILHLLCVISVGASVPVAAIAQVAFVAETPIRTSKGVVDTALPGQVLDVLAQRESWLLVSRGQPGWVKSADVLPLTRAKLLFAHRLRENPSADNHLAVGFILLELGEHEAAVSNLRQAVRLAPKKSVYWEALGHAYLRTENFNDAVSAFTQGINVSSNSESARMGRGTAYLELGRLDHAMTDLTKAITANPTHAYALKYRGIVHLEMANTKDALKDLNGAIKADPYDLHARSMRGRALCLDGAFQEAARNFTVVLKSDATNVEALTGRGIANHASGELTKAKDDFRRAIELTPSPSTDDAYLWSNLGQVLMETGEYTSCLQHLNRAIELDPNFAEAYGHRAILHATCADKSFRSGQQAKADATTYVKLAGNTFWTYRAVAATNMELGNFLLAVQQIEKAKSLADTSVPDRFVQEIVRWSETIAAKVGSE